VRQWKGGIPDGTDGCVKLTSNVWKENAQT